MRVLRQRRYFPKDSSDRGKILSTGNNICVLAKINPKEKLWGKCLHTHILFRKWLHGVEARDWGSETKEGKSKGTLFCWSHWRQLAWDILKCTTVFFCDCPNIGIREGPGQEVRDTQPRLSAIRHTQKKLTQACVTWSLQWMLWRVKCAQMVPGTVYPTQSIYTSAVGGKVVKMGGKAILQKVRWRAASVAKSKMRL